jgi:hypothetical protein
MGKVRRRQFMELARLAVQFDAKLAPVVEDWDRMKPPLQKAVDLDALCEAHGADPTHFISIVGEAQMRFRDNASVILAALSLPSVVQKSIDMALIDEGVKDREMLFQHSGLLPQPKASQIRALNCAAIRAEVNTNIGEPLPTFEETIADSDELTGEEE